MSHVSLILTLSGVDRPGLVQELAKVVADNGGNWEQSRMAHLADRFVGLLEVMVAEDKVDPLCAALRNLPDLFLTMHVDRPAIEDHRGVFSLELLGSDQPGIVQKITQALANAHVNIEEITTSTEAAPDSGAPLFRARMRLTGGGDQDEIRQELEAIAHDLMVEIKVES
ncbi:MAG: ACT domain-containing protein [Verrucomicrobiota bacterium]